MIVIFSGTQLIEYSALVIAVLVAAQLFTLFLMALIKVLFMTTQIDADTQSAYAQYSEEYTDDPTLGSPRVGYTSAGIATTPGTVVKEFRDRNTGASTNRNFVTVYFSELVNVTYPNSVSQGAILVEAVYDKSKAADTDDSEDTVALGVKSVWLPKKLCSNLVYTPENAPLNKNTVEIWNVFLRSNYPELELDDCGGE